MKVNKIPPAIVGDLYDVSEKTLPITIGKFSLREFCIEHPVYKYREESVFDSTHGIVIFSIFTSTKKKVELKVLKQLIPKESF